MTSATAEPVPNTTFDIVDATPPPFDDQMAASLLSDRSSHKKIGYLSLYRFATVLDLLLILIGVVASAGNGVAPALLSRFTGQLVDAFSFSNTPSSTTTSNITTSSSSSIFGGNSSVIDAAMTATIDMDRVSSVTLNMVYIGIAAFLLRVLVSLTLTTSADRQCNRIRKEFFTAALFQEIGWFDVTQVGAITSRISDVVKIHMGINEQVGLFIIYVIQFISCLVVGMVASWKLTLVFLSSAPIVVVLLGLFMWVVTVFTTKATDSYAQAGEIAQEAISSIRTVTSLNSQRSILDRYNTKLRVSLRMGIEKGLAMGGSFAAIFFVMLAGFGLSFWYGGTLVKSGEVSVGNLMTSFLTVMTGVLSLGQVAPTAGNFSIAVSAAKSVYSVIDRKSKIDPRDTKGEKKDLSGDISFSNVTFQYPTRSEVTVLKNFSLHIKRGQTVALVGPSGCGKSTLIGLLERFYDVEGSHGTVLMDGVDIKTLDIQHLRKQIGLVSQEPVLFSTTIGQNIAFGCPDRKATDEEIIEAAKQANAHGFIINLPDGYNTLVGERGTQLSGGQKQRIAIARSLIRKPAILAFDEATSALDTESEAVVQAAIDEVCHGHTCIIVAHRLSTVRNANLIVAMRDGSIVESGTHDGLMARKGLYYDLVQKQQLGGGDKGSKKEKKSTATSKSSGSSTSKDEEEMAIQKLIEQEDTISKVPVIRTISHAFALMRPDALFLALGCLGSIISGVVFPLMGLLIAQVTGAIMNLAQDPNDSAAMDTVVFWAVGFVIVGVIVGFGYFTQYGGIEIAGERLIRYLRYESLKAMLRQDISFFDDKNNSTGVLATRLSSDPSLVTSIAGNQATVVIQLAAGVVAGFAIGFSGSAKVAAVVTAVIPLLLLSSYADMKFQTEVQVRTQRSYEKVGHVVSESLENIRTVSSLCRQYPLIAALVAELDKPARSMRIATWLHSLSDAFNNLAQFLITALAYWVGAKFMSNGDSITFMQLQRALFGCMYGAMGIGMVAANLPSYAKATSAAHHIFQLLAHQPKISSPAGVAPARPGENDVLAQERALKRKMAASSIEAGTSDPVDRIEGMQGEIELKDVEFTYPSRPDSKVLNGLSFTIKPQQTVALVGTSGCGKSTVIQLLERFYDPSSGSVMIDGHSTKTIDVSWLRSQIGLVSQEPTLFATTIKENILYGKPGASQEEMIAAAKKANAHEFISKFPKGYETVVGEKGAMLSGGQKQRIAIARALIKDPKILLLDEATAALDSASETVVQKALDAAKYGRTTIVIAHRLSTVTSADKILVIEKGCVVEAGTHDELIKNRGHYFSLASLQM